MSSSGWRSGSSSQRGSSRGDDEPPWSRDWDVSRGGGTYRPGAERSGAYAPERPSSRGGRPSGRDDARFPPARGGGLWGDGDDDPRLRGRRGGSAGSSGRQRAAAYRGGIADPRAARSGRLGYGARGNQGARYRRGNGSWGAYDDERSSGMSSGTAFGVIVGALLLGGGAGYAFWHFTTPKVANSSSSPSSNPTPTGATPSATPRTPTATPHALAPGDRGRRIVWVRWPDAS